MTGCESCKFALKARLVLISSILFIIHKDICWSIIKYLEKYKFRRSVALFLNILTISSIALQKWENSFNEVMCSRQIRPHREQKWGKRWNWSYKFLFFLFYSCFIWNLRSWWFAVPFLLFLLPHCPVTSLTLIIFLFFLHWSIKLMLH